ncbi:AraC family transcriptional regulator [Paenibacillus phytohabitans]|nr:AraC family transcriptional regulator [Paenibacillus sp. FSL P4-0081]
MYEWNEMVQLMIDWIEEDLAASPTLLKMSEQLGYSPYYCTKQFHALTGMTLRDYIWQRRIGRAALELRDTDTRILDIAVKFGFSPQAGSIRMGARVTCTAFLLQQTMMVKYRRAWSAVMCRNRSIWSFFTRRLIICRTMGR